MSKRTEHLVEKLKLSARLDGQKDAETKAKIRRALTQSLEKMLGLIPEQRAAELFADIEAVATTSAAKLIRQHDQRPASTDALVAARAKPQA